MELLLLILFIAALPFALTFAKSQSNSAIAIRLPALCYVLVYGMTYIYKVLFS